MTTTTPIQYATRPEQRAGKGHDLSNRTTGVTGPAHPVADTAEIMRHLAAHGCPPVPAEPRDPTPFECHAYLLYEKRLSLGDSGEHLGREMDLRECQNVGHGGAYHRQVIAARWDVMRRIAEDTAGDLLEFDTRQPQTDQT